jgi:hypothetical protein
MVGLLNPNYPLAGSYTNDQRRGLSLAIKT